MFPLFIQGYKQTRHHQFIARTITQRLFPTVEPASVLRSASELLGGIQLRVLTVMHATIASYVIKRSHDWSFSVWICWHARLTGVCSKNQVLRHTGVDNLNFWFQKLKYTSRYVSYHGNLLS